MYFAIVQIATLGKTLLGVFDPKPTRRWLSHDQAPRGVLSFARIRLSTEWGAATGSHILEHTHISSSSEIRVRKPSLNSDFRGMRWKAYPEIQQGKRSHLPIICKTKQGITGKVLSTLSLLLLWLCAMPAGADGIFTYAGKIADARSNSFGGTKTPDQEEATIKEAAQKFLDQHPGLESAIGKLFVNNENPVSHAQDGSLATLSFDWRNPSIGSPVIGSVHYWANYDPSLMNPRGTDLFFGFTELGVSTTTGNHFQLDTEIIRFEPFFLAVPFDPSGNLIVTPGVIDGIGAPSNVAIGLAVNIMTVLEPSSMILIAEGIGCLVLAIFIQSGRRREVRIAVRKPLTVHA
jgi:hypothetical protein